jgi:hypothetical protein
MMLLQQLRELLTRAVVVVVLAVVEQSHLALAVLA